MREAEEALARVPFFADLGRRDLKRLAAMCVPKRFEAGAEILKEGAVGLGLFLITEGQAEVFKTEKGRRRRLAVLDAGDVLGEMALIDEKPRSASAVALVPTSALLLSRDSFRTVVKRSPDVAWALVPTLAGRLREVEDRLIRVQAQAEEAEARAKEAEARPKPKTAAGDGEDAEDEDGDSEAGATSTDRSGGLLLTQYALLMSGMAGLSGSLRVCRSSAEALADATDLTRNGSFFEVLPKLPLGAMAATLSAFTEAWKIPKDMLDAFQEHLDGDGDEDRDGTEDHDDTEDHDKA